MPPPGARNFLYSQEMLPMTPRLPPLLCMMAALAVAGMAHADDGRGARRDARPAARGESPVRTVPPPAAAARGGRRDALSDSVRRVQSRTGGQVLSAERVPYDGRDINRVKVVDERGRVRVYMDDPAAVHRVRPTRRDDD